MWKRWVEVRREERRAVLVTFVALFAIVAGHSILETARDALFLARIPANQLPFAYLAIALLIALVGQLTGYLRRWVARAALLPAALVTCALLTGLFWVGLDGANNALLFTLYIWSGLVGTFVVGLFWIRVGDMFDVGQAKRVFPLIGIGGVAGATAGSLLARGLLATFASRHLILAAVITYLFAAAWVAWMWTLSAPERIESAYDRRSYSMSRLEILRREPYLLRLALLIGLSMVTVTVVDYLFKSSVAATVPSEELGAFFATYYSIINALSALVQIVLAPILLSYLGVNRSLVLFPVLLMAGSLGLLVTGTMNAGLVLKGVDGTLRHSLYRTGMEILYLPLSADIRSRFKALLDGLAQRGGQAVASLAILGATMAGFDDGQLAFGVLMLALGWVGLGVRMRGGYLDLFRDRLSLGHIDPRVDIPNLDLSALEQLLAALNSADDDTVVTALDMFALYRRAHIIPALILYHPSSKVVSKAADVLMAANRSDVNAIAGRLLSSSNPAIRATALRLIVSDPETFAENEALIETTDDPVLQGMVVIGRYNAGRCDGTEARVILSRVFEESSGLTLCGLAQAMRGNDSALARWALNEMGKRHDHDTRHDEVLCREVALSMAKAPSPEYLPTLVGMLGDRRARPAVRSALVAIGPRALEYLEEAALSGALPTRQMRHIPRSISPFGGQSAVDALIRLHRKVDIGYFRFKILRGLGRLSADDGRLVFDSSFLDENIEATLRRMILMIDCRLTASATRARRPRYGDRSMDLLIDTLLSKEINAMERFFRFLAIRYPDERIYEIFKGLMNSDSRARAGSRELLENTLDGPYRFAARALVDELPDRDKLVRVAHYFDPSAGFNPSDLEAAFTLRLRGMVASSSSAVRLAAGHVIERLGLDLEDDSTSAPEEALTLQVSEGI